MSSDKDLFADFERMRREVDQLFGHIFDRGAVTGGQHGSLLPAMDIYCNRNGSELTVVADLAGVDPDSLSLEVEGSQLTLAGSRPPGGGEAADYQQLEIARGEFSRTVELAVRVDPSGASAVYEEGLLKVRLPIIRSSGVTHRVSVKTPHRRSD